MIDSVRCNVEDGQRWVLQMLPLHQHALLRHAFVALEHDHIIPGHHVHLRLAGPGLQERFMKSSAV